MKVFFSWSGEKSKQTAEVLSQWLKKVIQAVDPWMSYEMDKGASWIAEIKLGLESSKMGIICLTSENLESPWLHFEAGAVSKTQEAKVCTFLLDIPHSEVGFPLAQFQHTTFDKSDVKGLVKTVNEQVRNENERPLDDATLDAVFDYWWPELEKQLNPILDFQGQSGKKRTQKDILEEVLEISRRNEKSLSIITKETLTNKRDIEQSTRNIAQKFVDHDIFVHPGAIRNPEIMSIYDKTPKNLPSEESIITSSVDSKRRFPRRTANDAK